MANPALKSGEEDPNGRDRAEYIDGKIVYKALPGGDHAIVASSIDRKIAASFHRKLRNDGTGGWWILPEISIQYNRISEKGRRLTADIAGWKRERVPLVPRGFPIATRPDWVCEVCHTTRTKDMTIVPETLAAEGVPWYWFVDVEEQLLSIFHLQDGLFSLLKTWKKNDGRVTLPPFEACKLTLAELFGDEFDSDED